MRPYSIRFRGALRWAVRRSVTTGGLRPSWVSIPRTCSRCQTAVNFPSLLEYSMSVERCQNNGGKLSGGPTARTPGPRGGQGQRRQPGARVGDGTGPSPGLQKFEDRPCASSGNPHAALKDFTETAGTLCS